jgi:hypothetical protein
MLLNDYIKLWRDVCNQLQDCMRHSPQGHSRHFHRLENLLISDKLWLVHDVMYASKWNFGVTEVYEVARDESVKHLSALFFPKLSLRELQHRRGAIGSSFH